MGSNKPKGSNNMSDQSNFAADRAESLELDISADVEAGIKADDSGVSEQLKVQMAEMSRLKAENAALKTAALARGKEKSLSVKVSQKGAISVYGLGRFPVTLYRGQMERLLDHSDKIRTFIEVNSESLTVKG